MFIKSDKSPSLAVARAPDALEKFGDLEQASSTRINVKKALHCSSLINAMRNVSFEQVRVRKGIMSRR